VSDYPGFARLPDSVPQSCGIEERKGRMESEKKDWVDFRKIKEEVGFADRPWNRLGCSRE
jgi:hypothetical protein